MPTKTNTAGQESMEERKVSEPENAPTKTVSEEEQLRASLTQLERQYAELEKRYRRLFTAYNALFESYQVVD